MVAGGPYQCERLLRGMLRARASHGKVPRPGLSELGPLVRYQRHDELSQLPLWPMEARNPDTGHQAR